MEIEAINLDEADGFERIDSLLRSLITTIAGTIPGSRSFGLEGGAINLLPEDARNTFLMELDEKVEEFIPEVSIEEVEFDDVGEGEMLLRISVGVNEEEESDD